MASSASQSLIMAVVVLLVSATTAHARSSQVAGHLSPNPCRKTNHPKLCQALLSSREFQSDIELAVAAIKQAMDKIKSGIDAAEKFKVAAGADKLRTMYLEGCKTYYSNAIDDLQSALDYLTGTGSELDVSTNLSAALTDIDTCSTEWGESGMPDFPLDHVNANLYNLVSNVLSLGTGLKGSQS